MNLSAMMNVIAERPIMLVLMLLVIAGVFAFVWMQTGKRALLIIAAIFLGLIPVGLYVERVWVTDRESLEQTIMDIAAALEANDHETVFKHIDPKANQAVLAAKSELPRFEFQQVLVNRGSFRRFDVRSDVEPIEAITDFNINVIVSLRSGGHTDVRVPRRLIVKFRKSDGLWRAVEYTHLPIIGDPDGYSPNGGKPPTF
ncbi:MAG: hypothetical protein R3C05_12080 [Pirellulaceae bacterium]